MHAKTVGPAWTGPYCRIDFSGGQITEVLEDKPGQTHLIIPWDQNVRITVTLVPDAAEENKGSWFWLNLCRLLTGCEDFVDEICDSGNVTVNPTDYLHPLTDGTVARLVINIGADFKDPIKTASEKDDEDPAKDHRYHKIIVDFVNMTEWELIHQVEP